MPILALDKFGRIYETSPDRADGLGYKSHPESVERGDLTLGSSYMKADAKYQAEVGRERQWRKVEDAEARIVNERQRAKVKALRNKQAQEDWLSQNEQYRKAQVRRAIQMGVGHGLDPRRLTANGQTGLNGLDGTQKAIYAHANQMGTQFSFQVSQVEKEQALIRAMANQQIHAQAKREAKRVAAEASHARAHKSVMTSSGVSRTQGSKFVVHPMMLASVKRA